MNDDGKNERKARGQQVAVGSSLFAVGTTFQVLGFAAHDLVAQMIIRGASIFIMICGIIIMVRAIAKAKNAGATKGKSQ